MRSKGRKTRIRRIEMANEEPKKTKDKNDLLDEAISKIEK